MIVFTGVARITTSAWGSSSAGSLEARSTICRWRANSRVWGSVSKPISAVHLPRRARANEPPIRPSPRMAIRSVLMKLGSSLPILSAPYRTGDGPHLGHQLGKPLGLQGLPAIGERFSGVRMDFDDQAVRPGGNPRPGDGGDELPIPGAMARIEDHRQVGEGFQDRYRVDVGSIAGSCLEGADAPLA